MSKLSFTELVRGILGLFVVIAFIGVTATMLLYALFSKENVDLKDYSEFFLKTSGVYTGIVGVVVGYYFARASDPVERHSKPDAGDGPAKTENIEKK